jgi:hypothetical protein
MKMGVFAKAKNQTPILPHSAELNFQIFIFETTFARESGNQKKLFAEKRRSKFS